MGARHRIKKPNTTARELEEHAEGQNLQVEQHQHVDKSKNKPGGGRRVTGLHT